MKSIDNDYVNLPDYVDLAKRYYPSLRLKKKRDSYVLKIGHKSLTRT
jgi:hypothetical protein